MDDIILEDVVVKGRKVEYSFSVTGKIKKYFTTNKIWIEYPEDMSKVPLSILTIPFVANLIPITWFTNSVLWVREVDRTFYDSIKSIKYAYQELHYDFPFKGRFVSAIITDNTLTSDEDTSLLLFSGGVDAQTSYLRNTNKNLCLCNIQGWYRSENDVDQAADIEQSYVFDFAQSHGCSSVFMKSNFATIINMKEFRPLEKKLKDGWWHGFNHSMAFISVSIPYCYSKNIKEIIIASSSTIGDKISSGSYITTDSEFKYATSGKTLHDAFELTRQEKVAQICAHQINSGAQYPLRVCSFNNDNCCKCEKCFRTVLAIVAEGGDVRNFGFDIDIPLKEFYTSVMYDKLAMWGLGLEQEIYWEGIKERMIGNYDNIIEKDFVDWFMTFDFIAEKKKALRRYYATNFWSIVRRKIKERF
ncbi:MAG: hypothetical protein R3Y15_02090 [Rikenellaceae bacterium]